jgi:hypothetical protein
MKTLQATSVRTTRAAHHALAAEARAEHAGQAENQEHDPERAPDLLGLPDAAVSAQILHDLRSPCRRTTSSRLD